MGGGSKKCKNYENKRRGAERTPHIGRTLLLISIANLRIRPSSVPSPSYKHHPPIPLPAADHAFAAEIRSHDLPRLARIPLPTHDTSRSCLAEHPPGHATLHIPRLSQRARRRNVRQKPSTGRDHRPVPAQNTREQHMLSGDRRPCLHSLRRRPETPSGLPQNGRNKATDHSALSFSPSDTRDECSPGVKQGARCTSLGSRASQLIVRGLFAFSLLTSSRPCTGLGRTTKTTTWEVLAPAFSLLFSTMVIAVHFE